ncbi:hypothetical protein A9Q96_04675 [Rhodobacterales bacterium 52_120_T64]|nr:hypothetical protein A9Q96_04675 [Rhodobacterales bacterium 52_120_T64]
MTEFELSTSPPNSLRRSYLNSLAEPQEWFLEELIQNGQCWSIPSVAYGVTSAQTLVEFFVEKSHSEYSLHLFEVLRRQSKFNVVLAKSFDHQLLKTAESFGAKSTQTGFLFRKYVAATTVSDTGLVFKRSTLADLSAIWEMNDNFFSSFEEISDLNGLGSLWILEVQNEVVGCGVSTRVIEGRNAIDLGMLISPKWRRRGYGSILMSKLSSHMVESGLRPICGCAEHNIASRMTLQKAGFVTEHRLVHCEFD